MKNTLLLFFLICSLSVTYAQNRVSFGAGAGDFASTDLAINQEDGVIYDDCVVPTGHMFVNEAYVGYSYQLPIKLEIGAKVKYAQGERQFTNERTLERKQESLTAYQLDLTATYWFWDNDRIRMGAGAGPALAYRNLISDTETALTMINTGEHQVMAQTIESNFDSYEFRGGLTVNLNVQFPITRNLSFDVNLNGSAFCDMETLEEASTHTGSVGLGYSF